MSQKRMKAKRIAHKDTPSHPYENYESHRYRKLLNKGISDLAKNQDLTERAARPYIVGYLCKLLLSSPNKRARV